MRVRRERGPDKTHLLWTHARDEDPFTVTAATVWTGHAQVIAESQLNFRSVSQIFGPQTAFAILVMFFACWSWFLIDILQFSSLIFETLDQMPSSRVNLFIEDRTLCVYVKQHDLSLSSSSSSTSTLAHLSKHCPVQLCSWPWTLIFSAS